ncbi:efflux RND transporter periplasmic adaptor subunit [Peijinzhouia sedimentorum]
MKKYKNTQMKKYSLVLLIVVSIISLNSCNSNSEESTIDALPMESVDEDIYNLTISQFTSSDMKLGTMEMKTFNDIVKANGMFDVPPENLATVSTYFGGTVKSILLIPGEQVKKGQELFVLENPDYVQIQQEYLEAKGLLAYLASDYERQKNLVKDNVTSQKTFLKAESDYTVTKVKLESLGKKLVLMGINPDGLTVDNIRTTISIKSPINGFVSQIGITRGAFLLPTQFAIAIVNTEHLHLELAIFEKDLPRISIGQAINFRIQEDNSKEYQATVHLINKTVDLEKRTIGIHGHLLDESLEAKFNPGMYVEAEILTSSELRNSIPQNALVELDNKYYALVLLDSTSDGYTLIKKEVITGLTNDDYVEVLNTQDFKDNAKILINGAFNLITE